MGYGFTNYECMCGGIIQEEWDSSGTTAKCDSCNNPKSKEECKMLLNINIRVDENIMKGIDVKDEEKIIEKLAEVLNIDKRDITNATTSDYVVDIVRLEDINYAISGHVDEGIKEFFENEDAFETLCHRLKHKIEWGNEDIIHMLMDEIYSEKEYYGLE